MKAFVLLFVAALVGVSLAAEGAGPIVLGKTKEGYCYIDIRITEVHLAGNGSLRIVAKGAFEGEIAAMELVLSGSWKKLSLGGMYLGYAKIVSRGQESATFARALADALQMSRRSFRPQDCELDAILTGNPALISKEPFWLQLVYGTLPSDSYTEMYAYIDLKGMRMRFREGSPRFRAQLLQLMSGAPSVTPAEHG